jgi:hypothetical protein
VGTHRSASHAAVPSQTIPALLPPILNCIRMVWNLSRFYNTPERLTVLLRKLSNEIINRCCSVISLTDVFSGDVDNVMVALRQSTEAGKAAVTATCVRGGCALRCSEQDLPDCVSIACSTVADAQCVPLRAPLQASAGRSCTAAPPPPWRCARRGHGTSTSRPSSPTSTLSCSAAMTCWR